MFRLERTQGSPSLPAPHAAAEAAAGHRHAEGYAARLALPAFFTRHGPGLVPMLMLRIASFAK